ncbi:MAG: SUMF1/EgtB/PvdO family nonheme iron enzyme [Deltaproteobacteria bacterium]|nr:SUMF1/EgtB/PvdO family nonheme iron enzyme [Deltaproteobacteria bacterium]
MFSLLFSLSCARQNDQRNIAAKKQFLEGQAPAASADGPPAKVVDDPIVVEKIVRMNSEEVAKRLGAFRLERSWIVASESGTRRETVTETAKVEAAKSGAVHLTFELNGGAGFEAYWFPAVEIEGVRRTALVHRELPGGEFRYRENSAADERRWLAWALGPVRVVVDEMGGRLGFSKGRVETREGRRAVRFDVALLAVGLPGSEAEGGDKPLTPALAKVLIPDSPGRGWRGRKRPVAVRGYVVVDEALAVVTAAELHATLDVDPARPGEEKKKGDKKVEAGPRAGAASAGAADVTVDSLTRRRFRVEPIEKQRVKLSLKYDVRGIGADPVLTPPKAEPALVRPRLENERFGLLGMSKIDYFLIDRFEFPNAEGVPPAVGVKAREADTRCKAIGKRLCSDKEFRKACNGDKRHMLYPYGSGYDPKSCNSEGSAVKAAGASPKCKTTWGVYDLTGNVAEWTTCKDRDRDAETFCLMGGAVGDGPKARCRTRVKVKDVTKTALAGFRCCR